MRNPFKQNMGTLDRALRLVVGTVLLVLATSVVTGATAIVLAILSIPLVIPGISGFCPAYVLLWLARRPGAPGQGGTPCR